MSVANVRHTCGDTWETLWTKERRHTFHVSCSQGRTVWLMCHLLHFLHFISASSVWVQGLCVRIQTHSTMEDHWWNELYFSHFLEEKLSWTELKMFTQGQCCVLKSPICQGVEFKVVYLFTYCPDVFLLVCCCCLFSVSSGCFPIVNKWHPHCFRSVCSGGDWCGRPAAAVHPAPQFREGVGPWLPTAEHQTHTLLGGGSLAPCSAASGWGLAHDAFSRPRAC